MTAIVHATKRNMGLFNKTFVLGRLIVINRRNDDTIKNFRKIKGGFVEKINFWGFE